MELVQQCASQRTLTTLPLFSDYPESRPLRKIWPFGTEKLTRIFEFTLIDFVLFPESGIREGKRRLFSKNFKHFWYFAPSPMESFYFQTYFYLFDFLAPNSHEVQPTLSSNKLGNSFLTNSICAYKLFLLINVGLLIVFLDNQ
jgi:hypothetical protein